MPVLLHYTKFSSCYLKEAYWKHTPHQDINPCSHVNVLPLAGINMGTKVALCLPSHEYQNRALNVQYFLKHVQELYIETTTYANKETLSYWRSNDKDVASPSS